MKENFDGEPGRMSEPARLGQMIVLVYSALTVLISLAVMLLYAINIGADRLPIQFFRFGLTLCLLLWLYSGSKVAKGISVVLYGLGGIMAVFAQLNGTFSLPETGLGVMGVCYLSFAIVLLVSTSVNEFLEHQRSSN